MILLVTGITFRPFTFETCVYPRIWGVSGVKRGEWGVTPNDMQLSLVEETRLVRLLSRICLSDALNIHDNRSGCSSCCYKFHLLIKELHSIFVSYWGRRDDCKNSHWSPGSDTKTLVIFLAGFRHVPDKYPSEILCDQINGQLLIPIVEGDKVVLLKYQSELQRKLNNNCDNGSNLEEKRFTKQNLLMVYWVRI